MGKFAYFFTLIVLAGHASAESLCPAFLSPYDLPVRMRSVPRENISLFAIDHNRQGVASWRQLPMQIDPINSRGKMEFFPKNNRWTQQPIGDNDRIAFDTNGFANRHVAGMKLPCDGKRAFELVKDSTKKRYGYLVICDKPVDANSLLSPGPVQHSPKSNSLVSDDYVYQYLPENHLMFESIKVKQETQGDVVIPASGSSLSIRGDVKNFFTMNFDHSDVESHLKNLRRGPMGIVGLLTFYLRVLFFRIDLNLITEISFFKNSVYVPMLLNLPVSPKDRLHPSSGFLFTWENPGGKTSYQSGENKFPPLNADLTKLGAASLRSLGLPFCKGRQCYFTLRGEREGVHWALKFSIAKHRVMKGFFPQFVSDSFSAKKSLGWKADEEVDRNRVGIYFEVSGLPSGKHPYDFWILLDKEREPSLRCPAPIRVARKLL